MKRKSLNKLVRDKIPNIIIQQGKAFKCHHINSEDMPTALTKKLLEEVKELTLAVAADVNIGVDKGLRRQDTINEMADVFEVLRTLASTLHIKADAVNDALKKKADTNGRFKDGIFLEWVEVKEDTDGGKD